MYSIHIAYEEYELNTIAYRSAKRLADKMGLELVLDRSVRKPHYYKYCVEIWDDTDMNCFACFETDSKREAKKWILDTLPQYPAGYYADMKIYDSTTKRDSDWDWEYYAIEDGKLVEVYR